MRTLPLLLLAACAPEPTPGDVLPWPPLAFAFPVDPRAAISDVVGVDHDPATSDGLAGRAMCRNYRGDGFPACYDGHDGSDFLLRGGFDAMDAGSATVTAAADGVVIDVDDTHYDRCHASLASGDVTCDVDDEGDARPIVPNVVVIDHGWSGVTARYLHLMRGSALVAVGDEVVRGQPLARIGSSGRSSLPHLHFEVQVDGEVVDPYAGADSQPETWWCEQEHGDGLPGPCAE